MDGPLSRQQIKQATSEQLNERRVILTRQLKKSGHRILRGSLIERWSKCGKKNCHCQNGKGHGPKYYLSVSFAKSRPELTYVPTEHVAMVKEKLKNLGDLRLLEEELCQINSEFLKRRELNS